MSHETSLEVARLSDVERVIRAAKDVHPVHGDDDAIVDGIDSRRRTRREVTGALRLGADGQTSLRAFDSAPQRARERVEWLAMSEALSEERAESNGGGGSRTRVRRYFPAELYMRSRFYFLAPDVRKRLKTARRQTRYVSRSDAGPPSDRQPV